MFEIRTDVLFLCCYKSKAMDIQDFHVKLPATDANLFRDMAARLGWSIEEPDNLTELQQAIEEVERGEYTTHDSVQEYFKELLKE